MDATRLNFHWRAGHVYVTVVVCLIATSGCCLHKNKRSWCPPNLATPLSARELARSAEELASMGPADGPWTDRERGRTAATTRFLPSAEYSYAQGRQLESQQPDAALSHYFATVQCSWPLVESYLQTGRSSAASERAWQLYHSAVAQLIDVGRATQRFDPSYGLYVHSPYGPQQIETIVYGGVWTPQDLAELHLVGNYAVPELKGAVRQEGVGVPLVAACPQQPSHRWVQSGQLFAATALLRPVRLDSDTGVRWVLELHDPLRADKSYPRDVPVPLAYDLTAPIAYRMNHTQRDYLQNFLQPGATSANVGLFMTEPYQRGKIPVLFVHGLLSDPLTWVAQANAIRANPDVFQRYQLWGFEYPTGEAFFMSAAKLRAQLQEIRRDLDPQHQDAALDRMVIVGHSMGGLLAKLQVTSSQDNLWRTFAYRPFETLQIPPAIVGELRSALFFRSNPSVSRVIFIGTPHRGSQMANRCIGRIGAALIEEPRQLSEEYARMVEDNPGAFDPEIARRPPRSIDMLEPESPLLGALCNLPIDARVTTHSIIGTGGRVSCRSGPSDGVVPVTSAQQPGDASELLVDAVHEGLHSHPESIAELLRILREHATMVAH